MKTVALAMLLALSAGPVLAAVPFCHSPRGDAPVLVLEIEVGELSEIDRAQFYELRLRSMGIEASNTRFWQQCVQTFVREDGRTTLRYYDPWTLEEIPVE